MECIIMYKHAHLIIVMIIIAAWSQAEYVFMCVQLLWLATLHEDMHEGENLTLSEAIGYSTQKHHNS